MLNIVASLFGGFVFDCIDNFFDNFLYFNDNWFFNNLLDYLFYNPFNFFYLLFHFLDNKCLLSDNFDWHNFRNGLVDYFFNDDWLLNFNNFLPDYLNLNNLGDFYSFFYNFLNDSRNFHQFLLYPFYFDDLLDYLIDVLDDFNGDVDNFLYLLNFGVSYNFLNSFLDRIDRRHLDYSINNLFHDFGHLHNFMVNLEAI